MEIQLPTPISTTPQPVVVGTRYPLIDANGVLRIDNSSLEKFTTCARSAQYYLIDKRELSGPKPALHFGGLIHLLLELRYRDYPSTLTNEHKMEIIQRAEPVILKFTERFGTVEGDHRTPARALDLLIAYLGFYDNEPFSVHLGTDGKPFVEQYFEIPLGEIEYDSLYQGVHYKTIKVMWTGRIDLAVKTDSGLWVMDHKTTSMLGSTFFLDFVNSSAAIGYSWALQHIFQQPVQGLMVNALAVRKPSRTGTPTEFERQMVPYSQERIEEWKHNTLILVSDLLSHLDREYFPMETKWCVGKYGPCPYLDVCTMPPSMRLTILNSSQYEDVTWSPKDGNN